MKAYEGLFVLPPEGTPEVLKNQANLLEGFIKKLDGRVVEKIEMGRRPLGYPIRKFREGFFLVLHFQMEPGKVPEFRKTLELQEDLLKIMVVARNPRVDRKPPVKTGVPVSAHHDSSSGSSLPAPAAHPHHSHH